MIFLSLLSLSLSLSLSLGFSISLGFCFSLLSRPISFFSLFLSVMLLIPRPLVHACHYFPPRCSYVLGISHSVGIPAHHAACRAYRPHRRHPCPGPQLTPQSLPPLPPSISANPMHFLQLYLHHPGSVSTRTAARPPPQSGSGSLAFVSEGAAFTK